VPIRLPDLVNNLYHVNSVRLPILLYFFLLAALYLFSILTASLTTITLSWPALGYIFYFLLSYSVSLTGLLLAYPLFWDVKIF